jgi:polysaccharide pyruvyl transferase WcaK-like protein
MRNTFTEPGGAPARGPSQRPADPDVRSMVRIGLLDTSITSQNLGDQIITEASMAVIDELFPNAFVVRLATHEFHLWESYRVQNDCDLIFVGGSNLLKSSMIRKNQWKLSFLDYFRRKPCILLGCGWHYYEKPPAWHASVMLRKILSPQHAHSVRDQYSKNQLDTCPIPNVLNTACVTMWNLTPEHCAAIPTEKADTVVATLTGYHPDPVADRAMIDLLCRSYKNVHLWVQQTEDFEYAQRLCEGRVKFLQPSLKAYTRFLAENHTDYVGSRLHGGMRALQLGKRSLVLAIDNRATEIAKDTGLPVAQRTDLAAIERWITGPSPTAIRLPTDAIQAWKAQFRGHA